MREVSSRVAKLEVIILAVGALEVFVSVFALGRDPVGANALVLARRLVPQDVVAGQLGAVLTHKRRLLHLGAVRSAAVGAAELGHLPRLLLFRALALKRKTNP